MDKKSIIIVVIVTVLILLITLLGVGDKKVNWNQSYQYDGTAPFDTKVVHDQLTNLFKDAPKNIFTTFYEYVNSLSSDDYYNRKYNFISVSRSFDMDKTSFYELLDFVEQGNNVLISSNDFPSFMKDTLSFDIGYIDKNLDDKKISHYFNFLNDSLVYETKAVQKDRFFKKHTTKANNLGYAYNDGCTEYVNFIGIPYESGVFYLHSSPEDFSNYQILNSSTPNFIASLISYLPKDYQVLFDVNRKIDPKISQSPLRYILKQPSLKLSFWIIIIGLVLFMVFNAKRRQRIIPLVKPLENTTTQFVHSVSSIHYDAENYNGMIQKQITYFLADIRKTYLLKTDKLDDKFIKSLALKSGKPIADVEKLITLIIRAKAHKFSTESPLEKLNHLLEKFYS